MSLTGVFERSEEEEEEEIRTYGRKMKWKTLTRKMTRRKWRDRKYEVEEGEEIEEGRRTRMRGRG